MRPWNISIIHTSARGDFQSWTVDWKSKYRGLLRVHQRSHKPAVPWELLSANDPLSIVAFTSACSPCKHHSRTNVKVRIRFYDLNCSTIGGIALHESSEYNRVNSKCESTRDGIVRTVVVGVRDTEWFAPSDHVGLNLRIESCITCALRVQSPQDRFRYWS